MKVIYDSQIYCSQRFGGISKYFLEMLKQSDFDYQISHIPQFILNYDFLERYNLSEPFINKVYKLHGALYRLGIITKMNQIKFRRDTDKFRPEIYHASNIMYKEGYGIKKVVTIHDMIIERYAELFTGKKELKLNIEEKNKQISQSDKIITISEATKKDILFYHPTISADKIHVIYHGSPEALPAERVELPSKYLLFIGNRMQYKNFTPVLEAFNECHGSEKDLFLVCVGGENFSPSERSFISSRNLEKNIIHLHGISESKLNYIYQHALVFIFSSLCEGFGIPVVEAFANACPVILSDIPCFREVAQDAAMYFNPSSKEELGERIKRISKENSLRNKYVEAGKRRSMDFSWKRSADEHLKVYRSLI
jgi:glycosyltransferase involved in cell wall biosynthesis